MNDTFKFTLTNDEDGEETEHGVPGKNEVCSRCRGFGHHTNPAIDGNGITQSEWEEWGEDDRDNYMSGVYDVSCEVCGGNKVVMAPDEQFCSEEQKELLKLWYEEQESNAYYDEESAAERRMGA